MKRVNVTEFKSHCHRLLAEARFTGEPIEVFKRGKRLATVVPATPTATYLPGQFKDSVRVAGDTLVDSGGLGIDLEALDA